MKQAELAKQLGISSCTMSLIEQDKKRLDILSVKKIAFILNYPFEPMYILSQLVTCQRNMM